MKKTILFVCMAATLIGCSKDPVSPPAVIVIISEAPPDTNIPANSFEIPTLLRDTTNHYFYFKLTYKIWDSTKYTDALFQAAASIIFAAHDAFLMTWYSDQSGFPNQPSVFADTFIIGYDYYQDPLPPVDSIYIRKFYTYDGVDHDTVFYIKPRSRITI